LVRSFTAAIYAADRAAAGSIALAPLPFQRGVHNSISFESSTIVDPLHTRRATSRSTRGPRLQQRTAGTGTQAVRGSSRSWRPHPSGSWRQKTVPRRFMGIPLLGPGGGDPDIAFDRTESSTPPTSGRCVPAGRVTWPTTSRRLRPENFLGWQRQQHPAPTASGSAFMTRRRPTPTSPPTAPRRQTPSSTMLNNLPGPGPHGGEHWNNSTDGVNYTNSTAGEVPNGVRCRVTRLRGIRLTRPSTSTRQGLPRRPACDAIRCGTSPGDAGPLHEHRPRPTATSPCTSS